MRALVLAWLANTAAGALIGTAYFGDTLEGAPAFARVFAAAALVSSVAILLAIVLVLLMALTAVRPAAVKLVGIVQSAAWTLSLLMLFADTRVYGLFRYHVNGMVWNLLTTPGGQDTVDLRAGTWIVLGVGTAAVFVLEALLWSRLVGPRALRLPAKVLPVGVGLVIAIVVFEKVAYALADARGNRQVTARAALFPLYQRFTMKRRLSRWMHVDATERSSVDVAAPGLLLRYPIQEPKVDPAGARPNILIIVIDSLRADMLAPQTMPHVFDWSRRARVFQDHLSGGNATRFGVFSLVYGIHGTYWMPVYEERAPPVLVTALSKAGYDLRVISAALMSYPEFRSTAWVTMTDRVEDQFTGDKVARDHAVVTQFEAWMVKRGTQEKKSPFFCFVLLDAPHQTYAWPPDETVFQPSVTSLDYLELSSRPSDETIRTIENSYKNAVHFADESAAALIHSVESHDRIDNTVVIVTGDHGEEFFENGYFGHTSNFTPEQTHVTFVMSGPGIVPGVETRPTSHVDVAPTLLEMLGADPAMRAEWSQGENLLSPPKTRERVIAGWQEVAMQVDGGILHVPLEGHKGFVGARDAHWRPLLDEDAFITAHGRSIADLARACRRFLR